MKLRNIPAEDLEALMDRREDREFKSRSQLKRLAAQGAKGFEPVKKVDRLKAWEEADDIKGEEGQ